MDTHAAPHKVVKPSYHIYKLHIATPIWSYTTHSGHHHMPHYIYGVIRIWVQDMGFIPGIYGAARWSFVGGMFGGAAGCFLLIRSANERGAVA